MTKTLVVGGNDWEEPDKHWMNIPYKNLPSNLMRKRDLWDIPYALWFTWPKIPSKESLYQYHEIPNLGF